MIRLSRLVLCLVALGVVFAPTFVRAQDGALKIAVIDTKYILKKSKAGQSIKAQLDKERKAFLKKVEDREAKLRADGKALSEKKESMSKEDFLSERKDFDGKLLEANKLTKKDNRALERAFAVAMGKLESNLFKVVEELSIKENYTIVLRRHDVFLAAKAVDITERSLKALDKKLKNVDLEVKD